jgi:phosphatidate phosphatase APP1
MKEMKSSNFHVQRLQLIKFRKDRIWIEGCIVKSKLPGYNKKAGRFRNFLFVIRTYLYARAKGERFHFQYGNKEKEFGTNEHGSFSFWIDEAIGDFTIRTASNELLSLPGNYPCFFEAENRDLLVVSDMDDTLLRSRTRNHIKRTYLSGFRASDKRKLINATLAKIEPLRESNTLFFYLSRSESNLFDLLAAVILSKELPAGPIMLSAHLGWKDLLFGKKDSEHKFHHLIRIMEETEGSSLIFIGDDTQWDLEVYSRVVERYGSQRIKKVLIHQTRKKKSERLSELERKIREQGVEIEFFGKYND